MYIINVIADDESKIGLYDMYFLNAKTSRNFSINLKEVIDRFIWTIELCHILNFFKHFFNRTLFLTTTNAIIYLNIYEILDCKTIIYRQPLSMGYLIPRLVIS
jgi:hypothetical protein